MLFGSSSLLDLEKPPSRSPERKPKLGDKSHLLIVDKGINPHRNGRTYRTVHLPSPNNPHKPERFIFDDGRFYRIHGIRPYENPVSLFIGEELVSVDSFLASFDFDVIFIFISILFLNPDKFITMPSRIYECYMSRPGDYLLSSLYKTTRSLWAKNINSVKTRLAYICDTMESHGSNELLFRPNAQKLTHLLRFKVNNMVQQIVDNNMFIAEFSKTELTSSVDNVRKNLVTIDEDRCRLFCWQILRSYLSESSAQKLIPQEIVKGIAASASLDKRPQIVVNSARRQKAKLSAEGTKSITSFFMPK